MKHPQDHFSAISARYAQGRITYPDGLFEFLSQQCPSQDLAWDCATGSGQAAIGLARHFKRVIATDISNSLLELAQEHPNIIYQESPAEQSPLESNSVDLITVAQALHWFDLPLFWEEAGRVLKPNGILAFWGYNWPVAGPEVDEVLQEFKQRIASSWPEKSAILHNEYATIHPPFIELPSPPFEASARWDVDNYLAHLRSWSATRYYLERTGEDITRQFSTAFAEAWGSRTLMVCWPLILKIHRKE